MCSTHPFSIILKDLKSKVKLLLPTTERFQNPEVEVTLLLNFIVVFFFRYFERSIKMHPET